ncbi:hypothetical protein GCM10011488_32590 [Steroidobacter agaridevorans]|nr:hypothetical protein GCM10011488_32590 [Steroidobacter agaridevorans]
MFAREIPGAAPVGAERGDLHYLLNPRFLTCGEQSLWGSRMDVLESLIAALSKNTDGIDDHVDAGESRRPDLRSQITSEVGRNRVRSGGVTTGSNNPMASRTQCSGQPATDEPCGASDEDDHDGTRNLPARLN